MESYIGVFGSKFPTTEMRATFIRKVYLILTIILAVSEGLCATFRFVEPVRKYVNREWWVLAVAFGLYVTAAVVLLCCKEARETSPWNSLILVMFTLSFSYLLAAITAFFDTMVLLIAVGTAMILCLLVTLTSCQTKVNLASTWIYMYITCIVTVIYASIALALDFYFPSDVQDVIICGVVTTLFCLFLMYDTQQIMGGRRTRIFPEEHVFGTIQLFVDFIYIFFQLFNIFKILKRHN